MHRVYLSSRGMAHSLEHGCGFFLMSFRIRWFARPSRMMHSNGRRFSNNHVMRSLFQNTKVVLFLGGQWFGELVGSNGIVLGGLQDNSFFFQDGQRLVENLGSVHSEHVQHVRGNGTGNVYALWDGRGRWKLHTAHVEANSLTGEIAFFLPFSIHLGSTLFSVSEGD